MKVIIYSLIVLCFISAHIWAEEATTNGVSEAVKMARQGEKISFSIAKYAPYHSSALDLAIAAKDVKNNSGRMELISLSFTLESAAMVDNGQSAAHSTSQKLFSTFIELLKAEIDPLIQGLLAQQIFELFPEKFLQEQSTLFKELFCKSKTRELLLLYAASVKAGENNEMYDFVKAYAKDIPERLALCVEARFGGDTAEDSLIIALDNIKESSWGELGDLAKFCTIANTPRIQKLLARRLRSENVFIIVGGGEQPARTLFASILLGMLRDEMPFSNIDSEMAENDEVLDKLEEWAHKQFGIEYKGDRKSFTPCLDFPIDGIGRSGCASRVTEGYGNSAHGRQLRMEVEKCSARKSKNVALRPKSMPLPGRRCYSSTPFGRELL